MRHARPSRRPFAGCLIAALLLIALDCAGASVWLNTGTRPLEIELGVAGALILPGHGPRRLIDSPFNGWTIGVGVWGICQGRERGRLRLGTADVYLWSCP
jgi:hypothetical protein